MKIIGQCKCKSTQPYQRFLKRSLVDCLVDSAMERATDNSKPMLQGVYCEWCGEEARIEREGESPAP